MKTIHKIVQGDSRNMNIVSDGSIHLIITSPPYWQLKDYGPDYQIGFHNNYESYINNLTKEFGGKVFYIYSTRSGDKKIIVYYEVIDEIKKEISNLEK